MRRLLALASGAALLAVPAAARAQPLAFTPCRASPDGCARLIVPLDRSGATPGGVTLHAVRFLAGRSQARVAFVALAGGPGQATLPLAGDIASLLGPVAGARDLLLFDQRGTGSSGALRCAALDGPGSADPTADSVGACATQLGPARSRYTTADSVADLEALRQASGYDRLVLYGTSYGTKVALAYAAAHPTRVAALVLDSPVLPDGPDPASRSTFAAVGRVLGNLCARAACAAVGGDVRSGLAQLLTGLRARPLAGVAFDGLGHPHRVSITQDEVANILASGDVDPTLRAALPAAVATALRGDAAPLARLELAQQAPGGDGAISAALFYATLCEEAPFGWDRGATPAGRLAQFGARLGMFGPIYAPFDAGAALDASPAPQCAGWPYSTPAPPPAPMALPALPALILSGSDDLRTPLEDATRLQAEIPGGAQLLEVPGTGHSVLGTEPGDCARLALGAFLGGRVAERCGPPRARLAIESLPPAGLGALQSPRSVAGRAGRTLTAVRLTLDDAGRQLLAGIANGAIFFPPVAIGGLRGGFMRVERHRIVLGRLAFVPGVTVSGDVQIGRRFKPLRLRVGGPAAAQGTIVISRRAIDGTLGGRHVHVSSSLGLASAARGSTPVQDRWRRGLDAITAPPRARWRAG